MRNADGLRVAAMLDRRLLKRLAGSSSFARGEDYFAAGNVRSLDQHRGTVIAKVEGSADYVVKLWADGKELGYSCSCPRGNDGDFCKHCVAVALAAIARTTEPTKARSAKPKLTLDDVRSYL